MSNAQGARPVEYLLEKTSGGRVNLKYPHHFQEDQLGCSYPTLAPAVSARTSDIMWSTSLLLACLCLAGGALSQKTADSCAEMTLATEASVQKSKSPFVIHIDKLRLKAGEATEVSFSGIKGEAIKEFLLQARVGRTPVGTFTGNKDAKTIDCGSGKQNGVVHTSSGEKKTVAVQWTAPKDLKSQVIFYLTVLDSQGNYWVQQKSRTLNVG